MLNFVTFNCRYRLAPQHPYPEPFQDCYDAAKYFIGHAKEYNVNPRRIALAGNHTIQNQSCIHFVKPSLHV